MDIKTYRAKTMHEALALVRRDLGANAAVLQTREVSHRRFFGLIEGNREIEVTASAGVNVPSRLPPIDSVQEPPPEAPISIVDTPPTPPPTPPPIPDDVQRQLSDLQSMVKNLYQQDRNEGQHDLPESLFRLYTDLIDADLNEDIARELVERVRLDAPGAELAEPVLLKARVARMLEDEIRVSGPIQIGQGRGRLVALVGPTGVGKTTTIAKLAANHRLKEKQSVGLITVDTYRIAAVEQLRTYADIIDLPMQVVSTPKEMQDAVRRLDGLDLILMDTAGRSGRDEIKIQELQAFLTEAGADEVFLVLSSVAGARTLEQTARQFAAVNTSGLILTKLDEATSLGNLLPLLRSCNLPLGYLTNGQNVPDDIETADSGRLARLVLEMETPLVHG